MILAANARKALSRPLILCALMIPLAACGAKVDGAGSQEMHFAAYSTKSPDQTRIAPDRRAYAVEIAREMRAHGKRVWCVPFARNVSGVDIRGNAKTWWSQASGIYERSHKPKVGAVMAFSATRKMPMGHVAVVSQIVSDREVLVDHANWHRNKVSLGMSVVDVSKNNDWSSVRVQSTETALGRPYPVAGFIYNPSHKQARNDT